jgi:hypothetical protein
MMKTIILPFLVLYDSKSLEEEAEMAKAPLA